jgi:hypothetical protein
MNMLDIARTVFDRTWKPVGISLLAIVTAIVWSVAFGVASTIATVLFLGLIALVVFYGSAIYFVLYGAYTKLASKVQAKWGPKVDDIIGEIKAVSAARSEFNSAKAARKAAEKELKEARKQAKQLAKEAAKALEAQLIAASLGEDLKKVTEQSLDAINKADNQATDARDAKLRLDYASKLVEHAEAEFRNAAQSYRNSKSTVASTS